jgi:phage-related protein
MAFDTFTSTWVADYGTAVTRKPRLFRTPFGDGYEQVTANGINSNPEVWNLKWDVPAATAQAIEDFIVAHAAVPFKWTNPKGVLIVVQAYDGCTHTWDNYGKHTVTATFTQDFSPEV